MKKQSQLGMNPGTATGRLIKDLLFNLVKDTPCYHCGKPLTRDTFSIEHKVPWLDSDNPLKLFFDLDNISYSHHSCNSREGGKKGKYSSNEEKLAAKAAKNLEWRSSQSKEQRAARRREQYLRTGK